MSTEFEPAVEELLRDRYYARDKKGNLIENSWEELCERVSKAVAMGDEALQEKFYELIHSRRFLPNSPTLVNAGTDNPGTNSACFVIDIQDSTKSIVDGVGDVAEITRAGGGVGFPLSKLRSSKNYIRSCGRTSSGPVVFMELLHCALNTFKQGGFRRGAGLAALNIGHPDIREFILSKAREGHLETVNISAWVTDEFMRRVESGGKWTLRFVVKGDDPDTYEEEIDARELFDLIAETAWDWGEPGLIFGDAQQRDNPILNDKIKCCNPCGEQGLWTYASCNLGSIDVSKYQDEEEFNWVRFTSDIFLAVELLDNIVDINNYPLKKIESKTKKYRPIGLGIMGLADLLIKRGLVYGSPESIEFARNLTSALYLGAKGASMWLGMMKGCFPAWEDSIWKEENLSMRNCRFISIAPTGTISQIAGCSAGIEPYYSFDSVPKVTMDGMQDIKSKWDDIEDKSLLVTAEKLHWKKHIEMQAALQKYVDSSISKTINLPNSATVQDVKDAYMMAWKSGCKGITVFRKGCKREGAYREYCPRCKDKGVKTVMIREQGCSKCPVCGVSMCDLAKSA